MLNPEELLLANSSIIPTSFINVRNNSPGQSSFQEIPQQSSQEIPQQGFQDVEQEVEGNDSINESFQESLMASPQVAGNAGIQSGIQKKNKKTYIKLTDQQDFSLLNLINAKNIHIKNKMVKSKEQKLAEVVYHFNQAHLTQEQKANNLHLTLDGIKGRVKDYTKKSTQLVNSITNMDKNNSGVGDCHFGLLKAGLLQFHECMTFEKDIGGSINDSLKVTIKKHNEVYNSLSLKDYQLSQREEVIKLLNEGEVVSSKLAKRILVNANTQPLKSAKRIIKEINTSTLTKTDISRKVDKFLKLESKTRLNINSTHGKIRKIKSALAKLEKKMTEKVVELDEDVNT